MAVVLYLAFDVDWAPTALDELIAAVILGYGIWLAISQRDSGSA